MHDTPIALMRPRLPAAETIAPYLREIDPGRRYTNFGPLHERFRGALAAHLKLEPENIACVANGTIGLTLALTALEPERGGLCAVPAWTFAATAAAVCAAGLVPWFLDVDPETWALDPERVAARLSEAPGRVVAVMPVAPFGAAIDYAAWDDFAGVNGIGVVIDAAAGFDSARVGRAPVMISLHATKVIGVGEGGVIASANAGVVERVRRLSNFGFAEARVVTEVGVNAKLSEYAAAVGLAALAEWPARRRAYLDAALRCRAAFADCPGVRFSPGFGGPSVQSTFNLDLGRPGAVAAIEYLGEHGVEARRWWAAGCHRHPAFAELLRTGLPATERLAEAVIGLPFHVDLTEAEIGRVGQVLARFLSSAQAR